MLTLAIRKGNNWADFVRWGHLGVAVKGRELGHRPLHHGVWDGRPVLLGLELL